MPAAYPRLRSVAWYALLSRVVCVAWCIVADAALPDHAATGVRLFEVDESPRLPLWLTRPFTRWDAAHLLGVARYGYVSDHDAAFFPGYPVACRFSAAALGAAAPALGAAERLVVAGVVVSNACFVVAAMAAYAASCALLGDEAAAFRAAAAFAATPASVFFSTAYSESLAAACAFGGVALLAEGRALLTHLGLPFRQ